MTGENSYNFQQYLFPDESILYEGRALPGKGGKNIGGFLFIIGFMLFIQALMIWSLVTKTGDGAGGINLNFIIIFGVTLLFDGIAIWGLVYNLFLKKKAVADDFYCLTNKRAFKYEAKKDKLVFGHLEYYEEMYVNNVKDKCGDLYMGMVARHEGDSSSMEDLKTLKELMLHPDPCNMPCISFESIENPRRVLKLAKNARQEILKSYNM